MTRGLGEYYYYDKLWQIQNNEGEIIAFVSVNIRTLDNVAS